MAKANYLKNMKIVEVSLVRAPASPGADVLFTKSAAGKLDWRSAITGTVVIKAGPDDEARDAKGRWTARAIASIGGKQGSYRRQIAQAFSDKAKALAEGTVGQTVHMVAHTRPVGASPVEGGGVEFAFEHGLKPIGGQTEGGKIHTKVQIRPEHLISRRKDAPDFMTTIGAYVPVEGMEDKEKDNKAQRSLKTLHRVLRTLNRPLVPAFGGNKKTSWIRGNVDPGSLTQAASGLFNRGATGPVAPTSDQGPGGTERNSTGGLPVWMSHAIPPSWATNIQGRPANPTPRDKDGGYLPHPDATHETAGGASYYRAGRFVPATRPDIQRGIEKVHDFLAANPGTARETIQHLTRVKAEDAAGREHFTPHGDYVPPGNVDFQNRMRSRYRAERDRIDTATADENLHRQSPAAKLFGSEYDTGTPEQQRAALTAVRQDYRKGSLFDVPADFPVTRIPTVPHVSVLKWDMPGQAPNFAPRGAGVQKAQGKRAYVRAVTKAKIRV